MSGLNVKVAVVAFVVEPVPLMLTECDSAVEDLQDRVAVPDPVRLVGVIVHEKAEGAE